MASKELNNDLIRQKLRREAVRNSVKSAMDNIQQEFKKTVIDEEQLSDYIAQITSREKKLTNLNSAIFDLITENDDLDDELAEVETWLDDITLWKERAKRWVEKNQRNLTSTTVSVSSGPVGSNTLSQTSQQGSGTSPQLGQSATNQGRKTVKLPELHIKKFSGDINQWQRFWGQFGGSIDNDPGLTDSDKLIYLRSFLEGAAEKAIASIIDGEGSYNLAKSILEKRFGRTDLLISTRLNNVLKLSPVQKSNDVIALRQLHDSCQIEVRSLEALGMLTENYGELLAHILAGLLPIDLLELFSRDQGESDTWKIDELLEFLSKEIQSKERALAVHRAGGQSRASSNAQPEKTGFNTIKPFSSFGGKIPSAAALNTSVTSGSGYGSCPFCDGAHPYYTCTKIPVSDRKSTALKKRLCFLCMRSGHQAQRCQGKIQQCRQCRRKHHQILCDEGKDDKLEYSKEKPIETPKTNHVANFSAAAQGKNEPKEIMLQTVQAIVQGPSGQNFKARCLFDGGSHRCFVNEKVSRELQLEKLGEESLDVFSFESNVPKNSTRQKVKIILRNIQSDEIVEIEALETPGISGGVFSVPSASIALEMEKRGYKLSDSEENSGKGAEAPLDILIGADYFWSIAKGPVERLSERLVVIDTRLGWTLHGTTHAGGAALHVGAKPTNVMRITISEPSEDDLLSEQMRAFWDLEHIGIKDNPESNPNQENSIFKAFQENIKFKDSRYEVSLPWKDNVKYLGDNFEVAKRRTLNLIEKLRRDPITFQAYDDVIKEQIKSGIVERVNEKSKNVGPLYYFPHRGVIREGSQTTKLRVVQDGSSHAKNIPSLNDCIESGPNFLPELFKILVRFRENKIAITGDIEKAFHQILITEKDRDALRFLWIENLENNAHENLVEFRLTRVPFGVTASPFLLAATVKTHVKKYEAQYPSASLALLNDLYVDDLISGEKGVHEADNLIKDSCAIMSQAGMNLRKWRSNSSEIREKYAKEAIGESRTQNLPNPSPVKVLGLLWDEVGDVLSFDVESLLQFLLAKKDTKRWVLKAVARIFDPLGFTTPFTIRAKMLLQELWVEAIPWDKELESKFSVKFNTWCNELPNLIKIKIPRFYLEKYSEEAPISVELHGFVDASELAYASVFYIKSVFVNGKINVVMVASKAKVAPLKNLKIPRLELMGAVIGARLANSLLETLTIKPNKVQLWTDSTITLCWIRGNANRWKPFVQNRVREIQERTDPMSWNHVAGKENPADLPSRGKSLDEISSSDLWWHGPKWLITEEHGASNFEPPESLPSEAECELRPTFQNIAVNITSVEPPREALFELKYSGFHQVIRLTAWIRRFVHNIRTKTEKISGPLNTEELNAAEEFWIKSVQIESYPEEVRCLKDKGEFPKQSPILTLNPMLDEKGLMRVGGRLGSAKMSYREKHPLIIAPNHRLTYLIGYYHHIRLKHAGINDVLVEIRETFWIPKGRQLAKKVVYSCPRCKRFRAKPTTAIMAPLPDLRINPSPPFEICGIDHAGPIYFKPENKKCYIALYTCAVTRAVHLELVSDLTTESFLMSFRRFIARRGIVRVIFSDNASTFKRADADIKILLENLRSPEVAEFFGGLKISWRYIADRGAWWGGFWERMVKSVKTALRKVLGQAHLSYEEIETLLIEIEATINSRPITFVYENPGEPQPLTPAHFLVGKRLTTLPSQVYSTSEIQPNKRQELIKRLKYRQALLERFWVRWKTNYLMELRSAHHLKPISGAPSKELKVGDVVLIEDAKIPRSMWKLAVVDELTKGRDSVVRSALVRVPNGNRLRRPVQLLYNLELT